MVIRVGTWNVQEFGRDRAHAGRYDEVAALIRDLDCDVLMLQEVCRGARPAGRALLNLAETTGMAANLAPPSIGEPEVPHPALAAAGGQPDAVFHVALMWNPRTVTAHRRSVRDYGSEMWHALLRLDLEVDGRMLRCGSYHAPPFGRHRRVDEAERVVSTLLRPPGTLGIVGADWNALPADRIQNAEGTWRYWHDDTLAQQEWNAPLVYQCHWDVDEHTGTPTNWRADRRAGEVLWATGLRDTAALLGRQRHDTVGHDPDADMGARTIDGHRVTPALAPAVIDHQVVDTARTRAASDHLPVITTLDLDQLD